MNRLLPLLCCIGLTAAPVQAADSGRPLDPDREDVRAFIAGVQERHGLAAEDVRAVLLEARIQQPIIDAISRPAERVKPWYEYRRIFLTEERIDAGVAFWQEHHERIDRIAAESGVPAELMLGIIGVETYYGRIIGRHRVLDALATLAFEYPPRSAFFSRELEEFLVLAGEQGFTTDGPVGSYAGAMGLPQFIPSSYRAYAVDGDADGRIDLWESKEDILASVANYLRVHGWRPGEPVVAPVVTGGRDPAALADRGLAPKTTVGALREAGLELAGPAPADPAAPAGLFALEQESGPAYWAGFHNFYVITRYNRSLMYALAVYELGQAVRAAAEGPDAT